MLLVVLALGAPGLVSSETRAGAAPSECDERSWTAGTVEWCHGTLVYRDHVYDDTGANDPTTFRSPHGTSLNGAAGDVDHTEHGQALNSADLLALRVNLSGRRLHARFELNTLFPADSTQAVLTVDTDDNPITGGGAWGVGNLRSAGWDERFVLTRRDPVANVIEGTVTLSRDAGPRIRVQAAVALGDGTPMNVAFRSDESGNWWEAKQAAALMNGDVSGFGARVAKADFGVAHLPAPPPGPGFYDRVYTSDYPIAEGVNYAGVEGPTTATFHYLGRHQPYAVFVPPGDARHGVQLVLHGASAAHASVVDRPGMQQQFGRIQDRILVSPLGRGPDNSYVDWGARDALDVLADVESHYATDRERVFVSGYSMGGGGTLFLSSLFPDRFAGAVDWVGFTGDCLNGTPAAQGRQRPGGDSPFTNDAAQRGGCPLGTARQLPGLSRQHPTRSDCPSLRAGRRTGVGDPQRGGHGQSARAGLRAGRVEPRGRAPHVCDPRRLAQGGGIHRP